MTVDELIKELQALSQEGYGSLPVLYNAYYYEEVNWATVETDSKDEKYILLDRS